MNQKSVDASQSEEVEQLQTNTFAENTVEFTRLVQPRKGDSAQYERVNHYVVLLLLDILAHDGDKDADGNQQVEEFKAEEFLFMIVEYSYSDLILSHVELDLEVEDIAEQKQTCEHRSHNLHHRTYFTVAVKLELDNFICDPHAEHAEEPVSAVGQAEAATKHKA